MGVNIRGERELLAELERRIGKQAAQRISDKGLKRAANEFVKELKRQFVTFKDQGYSIEEITIMEPTYVAGERVVKIRWRGLHHRYSIIHLNEWGTVKNPNPRGKGAIARAMKNSKRVYREAIKRALLEGL
ncbi:hypothetical protein BIV60_17140 [Bacillus sp. MUM 116]|uniref:hypothetical protein n=1 Tax=Bacillus sp. MUM 116 TaxID=1678002 RepID=UPI0008F57710|nr:hypothetical protein [Bacillus sp. MUM 116]OIK11979.1 hypothetical protein BIV60_17140 [Bacillus sp. MUM 116]